MKTIQKFALNAVITAMLLGLGACVGMSEQGRNTAIGAGAGALGGAVLTNGSGSELSAVLLSVDSSATKSTNPTEDDN